MCVLVQWQSRWWFIVVLNPSLPPASWDNLHWPLQNWSAAIASLCFNALVASFSFCLFISSNSSLARLISCHVGHYIGTNQVSGIQFISFKIKCIKYTKYIKPLTTAWRCSAIVWDFVAASSFQVSTSSWQSSNSWPPKTRAKTVHRWPRWASTKPTKPTKISRGTLAWRDTKAMFFWYLFFRVSNSSSAWRLSFQGCWDVYPTPTMIFCNLLWRFRNVRELLLNHLCSSAQLQAFVAGHHHPKSARNGKFWEHQAQYKFQFHSETIIGTFVYIL